MWCILWILMNTPFFFLRIPDSLGCTLPLSPGGRISKTYMGKRENPPHGLGPCEKSARKARNTMVGWGRPECRTTLPFPYLGYRCEGAGLQATLSFYCPLVGRQRQGLLKTDTSRQPCESAKLWQKRTCLFIRIHNFGLVLHLHTYYSKAVSDADSRGRCCHTEHGASVVKTQETRLQPQEMNWVKADINQLFRGVYLNSLHCSNLFFFASF